MNDRERFHAVLNYEPVDHVPLWNLGFWPETLEKYKSEGYDIREEDYFLGADLRLGADKLNLEPNWFGLNPPFETKIIEDDGRIVLYVNHEGILMREKKHDKYSSMPQFVKFPVETREEFRELWSKRMRPDLEERIGEDWKEQLKVIENEPVPFIVWADRWGGFFGPLRNLVGVKKLCMLFYEDPDFLEEMMDADADLIIAIMSQILDVVKIDAFMYWEDMAYKTAPLISPEFVRHYMMPRYKRVNEYLKKRGVPFIGLDSDGNIDSLVPIWMESGIDFIWPFEVQAGMDINHVREKYGKDLRIVGGVDKRKLKEGPSAIDAELERVKPVFKEGGGIICLDHTVPPDISYENFAYFMKKAKELF